MKNNLLLLILALLCCGQPAVAAERMSDVRMLIDISGSMRNSDPDNLREPALDLMLRLLPEGSRAGVWTFGERVNMVVPYGVVDMSWKEKAASAIETINNRGLLTNIPDALELATFDAQRLRYEFKTSVILLTDGKVEVSDDDTDNARAARDLLTKQAIELRNLGVAVHTVALSENADWEFLKELAQTTGGLAEQADSAEALSGIFLQVLDIAAPTEQVPLLNGEFLIDNSVSEFTLLVFAENPQDPLSLKDPTHQVFSSATAAQNMHWFNGSGFTLVTVEAPAVGIWRVAAAGAISRVNVLSNLSLRVDGPEASMPAGHTPELGVSLTEAGQAVRNPELLELLSITVAISDAGGARWDVSPAAEDIPSSGEFRMKLPMLADAGRYDMTIRLDGGSFQRESQLVVDVYTPAPAIEVADIPQTPKSGQNAWLIPAAVSAVLLLALAFWRWNRRSRDRRPVSAESASGRHADEANNLVPGFGADSEDERPL